MIYRHSVLAVGIFLTSMLGGVLGGLLLDGRVSAQGADVVTATQINVVDDAGQLRAVLTGRDERGLPSLSFYDGAGQVRGVVGLEPGDTPVLRLYDTAGVGRLVATVQGESALVVVGEDGERTALLGAIGNTPVLSLAQGEQPRARVQLDASGAPFLGMFDDAGQRAVSLSVDSANSPFVTFYQDGRSRAALGVVQSAAVLNLSDMDRARLVMGVADTGWPSLSFIDEAGDVMQQLPSAAGAAGAAP